MGEKNIYAYNQYLIPFLLRWSRGNRLKVLTAIRCDQWRMLRLRPRQLHHSRASFHWQLDAAPPQVV